MSRTPARTTSRPAATRPVAPRRTGRRPARAAAAVLAAAGLALALSACSSDSDLDSTSQGFDFRQDDPSGYLACRDLGLSEVAEDDASREELLLSAAAAAAASQTEEILAAVSPEPPSVEDGENQGTADIGEYTVDPDALRTACEASDYDFDEVDEGDLAEDESGS